MTKIPFYKSEEDLSQKALESVKIEKLPNGLFNLKIYAKDRFSGSGYVITLSRRQLNQLTEAVKKFEENKHLNISSTEKSIENDEPKQQTCKV